MISKPPYSRIATGLILLTSLIAVRLPTNAQTATFENYLEGFQGKSFLDPDSGITFTNPVFNLGEETFSIDYASSPGLPPVIPGKHLSGPFYSPGAGLGLTSGFGFTFIPPTPCAAVGLDAFYSSPSAGIMTITAYSSSGVQVGQTNVQLPVAFPNLTLLHPTLASASPMTRVVVTTSSHLSVGFDNISVTSAPVLSVSSAKVAPGNTVNVAINYARKLDAAGLQFDLALDVSNFQFGQPTRGEALSDHTLAASLVAPGVLRVCASSATHATINNGTVAHIPITVPAGVPDHDESLSLLNVTSTNALGAPVASLVSNAVLAVVVPPQISAIVRTNSGPMHLTLIGSSARHYTIQSTTNLAAPVWLSFTNVLPGSNPSFVDATATNYPTRFYRAVVAQ